MTSFVDYFVDVLQPSGLPWWLQMDVYGGPNSAVAAVSNEDTGYAHRDKIWLFQMASTLWGGQSPEGAIELVNGLMDSIKGGMDADNWGRYANYVDSELSKEEAQQQYYGTNLRRLRSIKAELDPQGLFSNPQSIEPAS